MKYNAEKHHRKSIRLTGHDYSQTGAYFVTICTRDRECLFGDVIEKQMILNGNGNIARHCWVELFKKFNNIRSPAFVVMPNHIHGIIIIQRQVKVHKTQENQSDGRALIHQTHPHQQGDKYNEQGLINQTPTIDFVQQPGWILMENPSLTLGKIIRHYKAQVTTKIRKNGAAYFQWQRNYYDIIIRNSKEFEQKRNYIKNNPANWENDEDNPKNIKSSNQSNP
jgi:REP element-mobilizing transposase RayT